MDTGGSTQEWAGIVATLATAVRDGWRAGATALWAAGRRREAAWLRADHHAAAAVMLGAASGRVWDVAVAVRRCRSAARRSAAHPMLAAPWRDAARVLAVAAGLDQRSAALEDHGFSEARPEHRSSHDAGSEWLPYPILRYPMLIWRIRSTRRSGSGRPAKSVVGLWMGSRVGP